MTRSFELAEVIASTPMIFEMVLPLINPHMVHAEVATLLVEPGVRVTVGQPLIELMVDLSESFPHDCPPVSRYRVCAAEAAWLRDVAVTPGDKVPVGARLARFTAKPDEVYDADAARALRTTLVAVAFDWEAW